MITSKRTSHQEYQLHINGIALNAFVECINGEWQLIVGDSSTFGQWVQTFKTKAEAMSWVWENPQLARDNGIKRA